jgi:hypothetical protein
MKEVSAGRSAPRLMLRSDSFRYGISLALPPAVLGFPAVSYAGMATVNMIWRLGFGSDAPGIIFAVGGILYGVTLGVGLQCLVLGTFVHIVWRLSSGWLGRKLPASPIAKGAIWVVLELVVLPLSFLMTMLSYGAGPVFLARLLQLK